MRYLADSVILIDHFNGIDQATRFIVDHRSELALSVITRAELLTGFDTETSAMVAGLLDRFPNLPIEAPVADLAARLRRDYRWKLPDALQAAVARHHGLSLVTRNTRDFDPDRFGFVTVPYRL
ncbi:MAG: type II toxin-antitoxin system VapC family toxin [bacterium]|nr:type II toxin-antitoxin system VapC family toxin [bacterium]